MRRGLAIVIAIAASAGVAAASPVLSYKSGDLDAYLAAVDAAEDGLKAVCEALTDRAPDRAAAWLRIGPSGLEIAPPGGGEAEAAGFWTEFALGARDAARALYGRAAGENLLGGAVLVEFEDGEARIFDGATRSEGGLCDAMARVAGAMGGAAGDPFAAAREAARPEAAAPVVIGGRTEIALRDPPAAGAVFVGPDGVTVERGEDGLIVTAGAGAAPGPAALRAYAPGDPFTPVSVTPIRILPGAPPAPPSSTGAIEPGGRYEGRLAVGQAARLSFTLTEPGTVTFASQSTADLAAVLETEAGEPVAAGDDSPGGYDFRVSATLPAGAYVLKVSHCCGGDGVFAVNATVE